MSDHHYLQPQNLMYNGYIQLQSQQANETSIVQMRTLREQLNQANAERDQIQKELTHERQQKMQLQQEFQKAVQAQQELNYQNMSLRLEVAKYQQHQHFASLHQQTESALSRQSLTPNDEPEEEPKPEIIVCDECQFETKSQVSLFLHKINHNLGPQTPRHLHLPTRMFTTKSDPSTPYAYKCPLCEESNTFMKHELYPHIYQYHSSEYPTKCPICLLYFTHNDYLSEHKLDKHKIGYFEAQNPAPSGRGRGRGRGGGGGGCGVSRGKGQRGRVTPVQTPVITAKQGIENLLACIKQENPSQSMIMNQTPLKRKHDDDSPDIICLTDSANKSNSIQKTTTITIAKDDDELSCSYPGCGFTAPSKDRLQFHMSAHTMSKYKCPYCAYVGNILIDIRRHILKSKKHEGLNVFQCFKCDYGSDCERTFKDHLKKNHYGPDTEESSLDQVMEEIFLNENNKPKQEPESTDSS